MSPKKTPLVVMAANATNPTLVPTDRLQYPPSENQQPSEALARRTDALGTALLQQAMPPSSLNRISEAKSVLPPFLEEATKAAIPQDHQHDILSCFFKLSQTRSSPLAPMTIDQAKRTLFTFQQKQRYLGQNPFLSLITHCWNVWMTEIRRTPAIQNPRQSIALKGVTFSLLANLLHMANAIETAQLEIDQLFQKALNAVEINSFCQNSGEYRVCLSGIAEKEGKYQVLKEVACNMYPFQPLYELYDACWSLFLQSPKDLFFSEATTRRLRPSDRAHFLGKLLVQIVKMDSSVGSMIDSYCISLTTGNPNSSSSSNEKLFEDPAWLRNVKNLGKWLQDLKENLDQEDFRLNWGLFVDKYRLIANRQGLSPSTLDYQSQSNTVVADFAEHLRGGKATPFASTLLDELSGFKDVMTTYTTTLIDQLLWTTMDQLLNWWVDRYTAQGGLLTQLAPPLNTCLNVIKGIIQSYGSNTIPQQVRSIKAVPAEDKLFSYIQELLRQIEQPITFTGIESKLYRQASVASSCLLENTHAPDFARLVRGLYDGLTIDQSNLKKLVEAFEALLNQHHPQTPTLQTVIELSEWFIGNKTLEIKMLDYVIDQIWRILGTSLNVQKMTPVVDQSDWIPQALKGPKKRKNQTVAPPSASSLSTKKNKKRDTQEKKQTKALETDHSQLPQVAAAAEDLATSDTEEPPLIERTESDGVIGVSLPDDFDLIGILPPSALSQCVRLCQTIGKKGESSTSYLMNTQVFLQELQELLNLQPTSTNVISRVDVMRRALENVLRALLSHYTDDTENLTITHNLEYFAHELLRLSLSENVAIVLKQGRSFIHFISQANEAIHYPLSSHLRDRRLSERIERSLQGDMEAKESLEQVVSTGLDLMIKLLEAAQSSTPVEAKFQVPSCPSRGKVLHERAKEAVGAAPADMPPVLVSHVQSIEMAVLFTEQLKEWCGFISNIPVPTGHPDHVRDRNIWLAQGQRYLSQLRETLVIGEPGIHQVIAGLALTRRALKAILQASLYHNGIVDFDPHENNPRRLAERLGKGTRELPRRIGCVHGVTTSPATTPFRGEEEDFHGIGQALCELSAVSLAMGVSPAEDSYQIGGKTRTLAAHREQLQALWSRACVEMIFPSLSYLADLVRRGF